MTAVNLTNMTWKYYRSENFNFEKLNMAQRELIRFIENG